MSNCTYYRRPNDDRGGEGSLKKTFLSPSGLRLVQKKGRGGVGAGPRAPPQDPPLLSKRHAFLSWKLTILLSSNVAGGRRGKLT